MIREDVETHIYFVMEKIEGTRLYYLLDRDPKKFIHFIRGLLQELDKIHKIDPRLLTQIPSRIFKRILLHQ